MTQVRSAVRLRGRIECCGREGSKFLTQVLDKICFLRCVFVLWVWWSVSWTARTCFWLHYYSVTGIACCCFSWFHALQFILLSNCWCCRIHYYCIMVLLELKINLLYSYSTTNKKHLFLKLLILVKRFTRFGSSFHPSSGAQNCTYGNRHMSNSCCYLLLAWTRWTRSISSLLAAAVWHMPVAVCVVLSSWWWMERWSETCRAFYKNE